MAGILTNMSAASTHYLASRPRLALHSIDAGQALHPCDTVTDQSAAPHQPDAALQLGLQSCIHRPSSHDVDQQARLQHCSSPPSHDVRSGCVMHMRPLLFDTGDDICTCQHSASGGKAAEQQCVRPLHQQQGVACFAQISSESSGALDMFSVCREYIK